MRIALLLLTIFASCNSYKPKKELNKAENIIAIQPLGSIDLSLVKHIQNELLLNWKIKTTLLTATGLPASAYKSANKRYDAGLLLNHLKYSSSSQGLKTIVITDKDIQTDLMGKANWGVMGLAYLSGKSCVISSYRVRKYAASKSQLQSLMTILALHELGHTYSQNHCPDTTCIMQDAKGGMRLDDSKNFCNACSARLRRNNFLK